jgi:pimeloyl-ACP methyl ester carboxylesterase
MTDVADQPDTPRSYLTTPNRRITAGDGVEYAYRELGPAEASPLVLLQHFRGNLDNWDPALIDAIAQSRRVITVDYQGVGASTGTTADSIERMAREVIAFLTAMDLTEIDVLGFSIGSFVAQQVALIRPDAVSSLVLASTAPQGAPGMHGWATDVIGAAGKPQADAEDYLNIFFTQSDASRTAGWQTLQRLQARTGDRDEPTTWETRLAQYDAVTRWGIPNHARLEELAAIDVPVLVANGDSDPMILPRYAHLTAGLLPDAQIKIYPDAAHGFLFQHHQSFAADVLNFLDDV